MWAMIPMLRTRSSATRVSVAAKSLLGLPAVVGESLVGLRHAVHVVLALVGVPLLLERVEDLACQLVRHVLLAAVAREGDEPAQRERAPAALRHLDRDLVVRTADAARPDFEHRRDGLDGLLEHLDRGPAGALPHLLERAVDDLLGDGLLAVEHHAVHQLRHELALVDGVGGDRPRRDLGSARHYFPPFLAPYFERPCLRSATPAVSRAARITL